MKQILGTVTGEEQGNKNIEALKEAFEGVDFTLEKHETRFQIVADIDKRKFNQPKIDQMSRIARQREAEVKDVNPKKGKTVVQHPEPATDIESE